MKAKLSFLATIVTLLVVYNGAFAQRNTGNEKHDVKLNALNLIVFKTLDLSYEHIASPNSTFGVSLLANLQDEPSWLSDIGEMPYYNEKFAITPYYRHFFMNRYAKGFFLEAFGMFNSQKRYDEVYDSETYESHYNYLGRSTNFAVGIAIGGKVVSRKNFLFEFFGGVGRNLIQSDTDVGTEFVPRVGINLGYRF
ncbi:MAG TPA: DUF3575 domain-containing protein [Parapedobacter sp.]|uniref:DUF3575 domain-containing protein n=1 Tax=Parapedobacter sp. TaxID=1958893 RepID=UPI002B51F20F|nr:DUF3575 domain-containing protein [Parapedobacter sp.]HWK59687.1 DUF3575 domain-containing protein [Parapedobacter sp.]